MTMPPLTEHTESGNRLAGRLAIVSGVFGIVAFACLIVLLVMRPSDQQTSHILLRSHDAAIIVQAFCLIPFTLALDAVARRHSLGSSRVMGATAVTFLTLVVILLLLSFFKVVADVLYMIPQGAVGVWLIVVCRQKANGLPTGLLLAIGTLIGCSMCPLWSALAGRWLLLRGDRRRTRAASL
jgi:hypothetical protein